MTLRSHVVFALAGGMIILIAGAALLVRPHDRRTQELRDDMRLLRESALVSSRVTGNLEGLARELERLRTQRGEIARRIPPYPDIDLLADVIATSLDGQNVYGPTIHAGAQAPAVSDATLSEHVLPLRVDMDASLASIFNLLDGVESMDRLVRVVSVRAEADRLGAVTSDPPLLTTTIGLELVFDPPSAGEGF